MNEEESVFMNKITVSEDPKKSSKEFTKKTRRLQPCIGLGGNYLDGKENKKLNKFTRKGQFFMIL